MFHSFLIGFHWIGARCIPPPDAATNAERMTAVNMAMLMVSWWWRDELMLIQNASNIFTWSSHALMHSCSHALMLSCTQALMYSCTHAHMHSCSHAHMHSGFKWPPHEFQLMTIWPSHGTPNISYAIWIWYQYDITLLLMDPETSWTPEPTHHFWFENLEKNFSPNDRFLIKIL